MTIPSRPESSRMPLQESLALHPQTTTIMACNLKIHFLLLLLLLLAVPYGTASHCVEHRRHM